MTTRVEQHPEALTADLRARAERHLDAAAIRTRPDDVLTTAILGCGYMLCALHDQHTGTAERAAFSEWGPT